MTEQWAQNMVPHAYVRKNRGSLSFHSDMPMAPAKPLQLVWAGVNRLTYEGQVAGPQHRVTVEEALRAITIEAAYSIQLEKEVGSIEVGKHANLTILEQNPLEVPAESLKDIRVWGTMLEGRLQPVEGANQEVSWNRDGGLNRDREAVRRWNAQYWGPTRQPQAVAMHGDRSDASSAGRCPPGCSCSLAQVLASHIEAQLEVSSEQALSPLSPDFP
jgi:hypothetical protein